MEPLRNAVGRIVPAVIVAAGVTLVAAGLLTYLPDPASGLAQSPTASPTVVAVATPSPTVTASPRPTPLLPSLPTPEATPAPQATRVVVTALGIDLPIVPGDLQVAGNVDDYPLCDVAQFLVGRGFVQPAQEGTTYLYGHARQGMFLPMLEASLVDDGAAMIDALVEVYTADGRRYLYEIFQVKRHATDLSIAETRPGEHRLILQTSEGPRGTVPKLQVAARLLSSEAVDPVLAAPSARPRPCP